MIRPIVAILALALFVITQVEAEVTISASPMELLDENGVPIEGVTKSTSREKLMEKASKQGKGVYRGESSIKIIVTDDVIEPIDPIPCGEGFTGFEPICIPIVAPSCPENTVGTPPDCEPLPITCDLPYVLDTALNKCFTSTATCQDAGWDKANGDLTGCMNDPMPPMGGMPVVDKSQYPVFAVGSGELLVRDRNELATVNSINSENGFRHGEFRILCGFSHMSKDDPLAKPNVDEGTHEHTFFGNVEADENSTNESLMTSGNTTCFGGTMNRSAYWHPTMVDTATNTPKVPRQIQVYYKTWNSDTVVAPPQGLNMISRPHDSGRTTRYTCNSDYNRRAFDKFPDCKVGESMEIMLGFPSCWDGINLYKQDQSHMTYGNYYTGCPSSHPVQIPDITFNIYYDVDTPIANWRLSSDMPEDVAGSSIHGDWMNGWTPEWMDKVLSGCLNAGKDCHSHLVGDNLEMYR